MAASSQATPGSQRDPTQLRQKAIEIEEFRRNLDRNAGLLVKDAKALHKAINKEAELSAAVGVDFVPARAAAAEALGTLASFGNQQAKNLAGRGGMPSAEDFINALTAKFRPAAGTRGKVNFRELGAFVSGHIYDTPTVRLFLGTMTIPLKEAKARQTTKALNRQKDEHLREKPKEVGEDDPPAVEEARNAKRAAEIFDSLKKLTLVGGSKSLARDVECEDGKVRTMLPMVNALFDPWSYSQTVENIFYFSFLVKQQMAGIFLSKEGKLPWITLKDVGRKVEETAVAAAGSGTAKGGLRFEAKQFILQIDLESWTRICTHHKLSQPLLPHRHSKDSAAPSGFVYADSSKPVSGTKRKGDEAAASSPKRHRDKD